MPRETPRGSCVFDPGPAGFGGLVQMPWCDQPAHRVPDQRHLAHLHGPFAAERLQQPGKTPPVLGHVEAAVVAQVEGTEAQVVAKTSRGRTCAAPAIARPGPPACRATMPPRSRRGRAVKNDEAVRRLRSNAASRSSRGGWPRRGSASAAPSSIRKASLLVLEAVADQAVDRRLRRPGRSGRS